ncbi:hypothetical protein, partial [Burkholderia ubonensis]|uniref:hypothetical protein n=1 Tax=Burkholderia ubonensis TaxID=101571 RepID=UPI001C42FB09
MDFNGEGEPSIDRFATPDVDIRPPKPLERLWILTVRVSPDGPFRQPRCGYPASEATRKAVDFNGEGEPSIDRFATPDVDIRPS